MIIVLVVVLVVGRWNAQYDDEYDWVRKCARGAHHTPRRTMPAVGQVRPF